MLEDSAPQIDRQQLRQSSHTATAGGDTRGSNCPTCSRLEIVIHFMRHALVHLPLIHRSRTCAGNGSEVLCSIGVWPMKPVGVLLVSSSRQFSMD
ncbi:hypothetical protein Mapa_003345 [Marchantia paleacea]|nr:hypothetical protein Mapa_003345 [Marchantia paleacea]